MPVKGKGGWKSYSNTDFFNFFGKQFLQTNLELYCQVRTVAVTKKCQLQASKNLWRLSSIPKSYFVGSVNTSLFAMSYSIFPYNGYINDVKS